MERLSLLMPTRGRPQLARRFLQSARDRARRPQLLEAVLYVDDDDEESKCIACSGIDLVTIVGPRASMGTYTAACLRRSSGEIIILVNDDVVIRTHGWDDEIRSLHERVTDEIYLAYPNDLFKADRVCTFPILSRRMCDLLGDPFPAEYQGAFIDYHLLDIFKRLQRCGLHRIVYLPQVVFEHMHYRAGKGEFDETYRNRPRFEDDSTFLALASTRSAAALTLSRAVRAAKSDACCAASEMSSVERPAVRRTRLLRATLLDAELPLPWRLRLFAWFWARKIAASSLALGSRSGFAHTAVRASPESDSPIKRL